MVAMVTGGGTGIGRELALALSAEHAVAVAGRRLGLLHDTVHEIESRGGKALAVELDVTDRAAVHRAVTEVTDAFGPVDALVNNAGYGGRSRTFSAAAVDDWPEILAVNVLGAVYLCAELVPGMVARSSGCVVNINSLQASRSFPGFTAYGASKAALMRLTDGLAGELEGTGVIAVDVSPGLVATDMTREPDLAPLLTEVAAEDWTPVEKVVRVVARIVSERPAVLNGRFVHAEDDFDDLLVRLAAADGDARRLRMTPMRPDPLFD